MLRVLALLLLAACGRPGPDAPAPAPPEAGPRVVAIGDLHGDLGATLAALRLAGALAEEGAPQRWVGGALVVVQLGDQLDRGDDELAILDLLERLQGEAREAGGDLVILNGNHELMTVAGDLRYATAGAIARHDGPDGRAAAFSPGSPLARRLSDRPLHAQVGQTLFAHAGILPAHLDIGREGRAGAGRPPPRAGGHHRRRDGAVWRVDVGLSAHYGGPVEVLRIDGDALEVLRAPPSPNPHAPEGAAP